jgi:hypothetical protein
VDEVTSPGTYVAEDTTKNVTGLEQNKHIEEIITINI